MSLVLTVATAGLAGPAWAGTATTLDVTRFDDHLPDGCTPLDCTLREALVAAALSPGSDQVVLPAGTYNLSLPGTGEDSSADGDLDVPAGTSISGAGAGTTMIDGSGGATGEGVFDVLGAATISGVTVRNSVAPNLAGVYARPGSSLTMNDVVVSGHRTGENGYGSGIVAEGALSLNDVEVSNNSSGWGCCAGIFQAPASTAGTFRARGLSVVGNASPSCCSGLFMETNAGVDIDGLVVRRNRSGFDCCTGVFAKAGGRVSIKRAYVAENEAPTCCAGIYLAPGTASRIEETTVASNVSSFSCCVGIHTLRSLDVVNTTVSGNRGAECCAGITLEGGGVMTVRNTTVTGNAANTDASGSEDHGAGVVNKGGVVRVANTISAGNRVEGPSAGTDCRGAITSLGHNLFGTTSGCSLGGDAAGDIVGVDPGLEPLGDHGGPTPTHPLALGSPAIDAGAPAGSPGEGACEPTDQRGVARTACDIGAYELAHQPPDGPTDDPTDDPADQPAFCFGILAGVLGSPGDDVLRATTGDDVIVGFTGADRISAGAGDDRACGEAGEDVIRGGAGRDRLDGGGDADVLRGGSGRDRLAGGEGNDRLVGGGGRDLLIGGPGRDVCIGGPGRDRARGCERKIRI